MFIAEAKRRCPQLVVVPYEFERYHAISDAVYRLLLAASACVQPLSCDEAFLDVTGLGEPQEIARQVGRAAAPAASACWVFFKSKSAQPGGMHTCCNII
jgi:nucleotidyltransferase/DNA polymerase involved in DNA repair